jgi:anti-anti-sigma factor
VISNHLAGATQAWLTPGPLRIDLNQDGPGVTTIYLRGELDRATAPTLVPCLNQVLDADTHCTSLIIDLTAAAFVDAGGLNLLLDAHRRATAAGTAFCLTGCNRAVLRILQITETTELLRPVPSQPTAAPAGTSSTAHTDLPSSNSVTPHRIDRADTTCNPRPRWASGSIRRSRGGAHR